MGFGLPAAIGAKLARPDKDVVVLAGDGSIQMNFQELVVAVEHEIPVKVIILNNGYLGMVRQWQDMFYKKQYSATRLGQDKRGKNENIRCSGDKPRYLPDFVMLAHAHGAAAARVCSPKELVPALQQLMSEPGPAVLECMVHPYENVYPMVPAGKSLREMICSLA